MGKVFKMAKKRGSKKSSTKNAGRKNAAQKVRVGQKAKNSERDITERKKTEDIVKKERVFTSSLINGLSDGLAVVDNEGKQIIVNDRLVEMTGFSRDELQNQKPPFKYWAEEGLEDINKAFEEALRDIEGEYELIFKKKSGERFLALVSPRTTKDSQGNQIFFGTIKDITEQKRAQESLKRSEKLHRITLSRISDTVVITNDNGAFTWICPNIDVIFGFNEQEVSEMGNVKKLLGKNVFEPKELKKTGEIQNIERDIVDKNGNKHSLLVNVKKVDIDGGNTLYTAHDVTERKIAEDDLKIAYGREQNISKILQKSLLPLHVPEVRGLDVKLVLKSATEEAEVGGDFYDIFPVPGNNFGIVMGDVSGKGVEVAAETAKVKYLILDRAYAGLSPSQVLGSVNNTLVKQETERFTALTYCVFDPDTGLLRFSNAGNPYPYELRNDRFIELTGVPISVKSGALYSIEEVKLEKDDLFVMFTDGLTEARYKGELFGEERARKYIKKNKGLTLNKLVKGLVKEATDFAHGKLPDDFLIIAMKRKELTVGGYCE